MFADATVTSRFYTTEKVGNTRYRTPEGFLVLVGVPVARTGMMIYGAEETPVEGIVPGTDNLVYIYRTDKEVFSPDTVTSANGKPLVNEHPEGEVVPANWRQLTNGITFNARRGTGDQSDLLLVDIVVYDKATADLIERDEKLELSAGYSAEYFSLGAGRGEQRNIIINHVAQVEAGRCGARCSIGDTAVVKGGTKKMKQLDKVLAAVRAQFTKDEDGEAMEPHIHIHTENGDKGGEAGAMRTKYTDEALDGHFKRVDDCMAANHKMVMDSLEDLRKGMADTKDAEKKDPPEEEEEGNRKEDKVAMADEEAEKKKEEREKIEDEMAEEVPEELADSARRTKDSRLLREPFSQVAALAEIIAPGIRIPTFDAAASRITGLTRICNLRKSALAVALTTDAELVKTVRGRALTKDGLARMSCDSVRVLFNGVGNAKRADNRSAILTRDGNYVPPGATGYSGGGSGVVSTAIRTPADLNKLYAQRFGQQ